MSDKPEKTSRKEDYKAYSERDIEDGWPYSDEPGNEESRLSKNRPYADEEHEAMPLGVDGYHVEDTPENVGASEHPDEAEEALEDAENDDVDQGVKHDKSADPEVDPRPDDI